jgi:transcriptional regulator with XRE-family HTH domain
MMARTLTLPKKLTITTYRRRAKIGQTLRALREKRGRTMMDTAVLAGVSLSTWARWENGKTAIPLELVADICRALGRDLVAPIKPYLAAA